MLTLLLINLEVCVVIHVFGNVIVDILPSLSPLCVSPWDDKDGKM